MVENGLDFLDDKSGNNKKPLKGKTPIKKSPIKKASPIKVDSSKEEEVKQETPVAEQTFTKEDVQKMIQEALGSQPKETSQSNETLSLLTDVIKELKRDKTPEVAYDDYSYAPISEIDESDYIEGGKPFFCYNSGYIIADDKRSGQQVRAPRGIISFDFQYCTVKGQGRNSELFNLCQFVSYSKNEVKWLQDHSMFNVDFFEKFEADLEVGSSLSKQFSRASNVVSSMSNGDVVRLSKERKLKTVADYDKQRSLLVESLAQEYIENSKSKGDQMLAAIFKQKGMHDEPQHASGSVIGSILNG